MNEAFQEVLLGRKQKRMVNKSFLKREFKTLHPWQFFCPKDPDPSKLAILRTQPLLCRFKPFHWRVQWSLGWWPFWDADPWPELKGFSWPPTFGDEKVTLKTLTLFPWKSMVGSDFFSYWKFVPLKRGRIRWFQGVYICSLTLICCESTCHVLHSLKTNSSPLKMVVSKLGILLFQESIFRGVCC